MLSDHETILILSALISAATSFVTTLTALIGIPILIHQSRQAAFSMKVDNLLKKEEFFESENMMANRRKAANAIRKQKFGPEIEDVLDFFEGVGLLLKKGAVDPEMVWSDFSETAFGYWYSSDEYIKQERNKDKYYWENFEHLINVLLKISKRKYRSSNGAPSEAELDRFLLAEIKKTNQK
jgi:hypothetical protein